MGDKLHQIFFMQREEFGGCVSLSKEGSAAISQYCMHRVQGARNRIQQAYDPIRQKWNFGMAILNVPVESSSIEPYETYVVRASVLFTVSAQEMLPLVGLHTCRFDSFLVDGTQSNPTQA